MANSNIFNQANNSTDIKSTLLRLLPNGKFERGEYVALNPIRNDKTLGSFRISSTGKWIEHATGDKGGDIVSLVSYLQGISQYEAANYLLGNSACLKNQNLTTTPPKASKVPKVDVSQYVNKLWNETWDARCSIVQQYLESRGVLLQNIPTSIRYHSNLYHTPNKRYFPAMVAAVTKWPNDIIIGLHRTYLKGDGRGKADIEPNKMMLGKVSGGAVMLSPASSKLVIAEGLETALSIYVATGFATWAALSAWGIANVQVPPIDITPEIIIAADADATGIAAANKLAIRLLDNGYKVSLATPSSQGQDFNDLLREVK